MPADQRYTIGLAGIADASEQAVGRSLVVMPISIDHRTGTPAHGGDVTDVGHHRRPAGEPGRLGDEVRQHAFDGQQLVVIPAANRGSVVSGQGVKCVTPDAVGGQDAGRVLDRLLGAHSVSAAQGGEQTLQVGAHGWLRRRVSAT
ncbi:hypothetical protein D3C76_873490 [compost metagenome]